MALFLLDRRKSTRLRDVGLDLARCGGEVDQAKKLIDQHYSILLQKILAKNSCKKFLQQILEKIDL